MRARELQRHSGKLVDITFVILGVRRTNWAGFRRQRRDRVDAHHCGERRCSWAAVRAARRPWRGCMRVGSSGIGATNAAGANRARICGISLFSCGPAYFPNLYLITPLINENAQGCRNAREICSTVYVVTTFVTLHPDTFGLFWLSEEPSIHVGGARHPSARLTTTR